MKASDVKVGMVVYDKLDHRFVVVAAKYKDRLARSSWHVAANAKGQPGAIRHAEFLRPLTAREKGITS